LQTLHNDALGMGWIPSPILPRKLWPKMTKKAKRAITEAEHITLMGAVDDEWRLNFNCYGSSAQHRPMLRTPPTQTFTGKAACCATNARN